LPHKYSISVEIHLIIYNFKFGHCFSHEAIANQRGISKYVEGSGRKSRCQVD